MFLFSHFKLWIQECNHFSIGTVLVWAPLPYLIFREIWKIPCVVPKFPVFSLSGKIDYRIPCFRCAVTTQQVFGAKSKLHSNIRQIRLKLWKTSIIWTSIVMVNKTSRVLVRDG